MIIVNDKRNMIVFSDALTGINVHQNEPILAGMVWATLMVVVKAI